MQQCLLQIRLHPIGAGIKKLKRFTLFFIFLMVAFQARAQTDNPLQITTDPSLYPNFDPAITDYVVRGSAYSPVRLSVNAPSGTQVSVDDQSFQGGSFNPLIYLGYGQSFSFQVKTSSGDPVTYSVRRLPRDFPTWTTERNGNPQTEWYVTSPTGSLTTTVYHDYAIIFDNHGVPLWWYLYNTQPLYSKILPDGNVAWTSNQPFEERRFDGSFVHSTNAAIGAVDPHELQVLPNGDTVIIADDPRSHVDLSYFGGSTDATIIDNIVEEIAPDGSLVWSWDAMDHIPVTEGDKTRWKEIAALSDPYHMNSVEPDGDGFVLSFRHLDTVLKVDKATGAIVWRLGGAPHPESLTFVNDPYGNTGGQHDARILPDGSLTFHDNGTYRGRAPRGVRFALDLTARTATFLEQITDPDVSASICCGDARKLSTGDWVTSWGGTPYVSEYTPDGTRVFRLNFGDYFSYRVEPIPFGTVNRSDLRNGMDSQFPRSEPTNCVPGDLDNDSQVTVEDALLLLKGVVQLVPLSLNQAQAGDINHDLQLNIADVLGILQSATDLTPLTGSCTGS